MRARHSKNFTDGAWLAQHGVLKSRLFGGRQSSEIDVVTGGEANVLCVILSMSELMDSAPKTTYKTLDMGAK